MYTATVLGREPYDVKFETMDSLARRLGGDSWAADHSTAHEPTWRHAQILRTDRYGTHVVCKVSVPPEVVSRGPGRPEVGPPIHIRLQVDTLTALDEWAAERGITRAEAARRILTSEVDRT